MLKIEANHSKSQLRKTRLAAQRKLVRRFITYKDLEKAQAQLHCARTAGFRPRMRVIPPLLITDNASL